VSAASPTKGLCYYTYPYPDFCDWIHIKLHTGNVKLAVLMQLLAVEDVLGLFMPLLYLPYPFNYLSIVMEQSSYAIVVFNMIAIEETYYFNWGRPMNSPMPSGLLRLSTLSIVSLLVSVGYKSTSQTLRVDLET
jgi:hypothetical protein